MIIKTKGDWIALATKTLPRLPDYAASFGVSWDEDRADLFELAKDYRSLCRMFNSLWERLPDHSGIRHGPFFDLCDLCSEYDIMRKDV